MLAPEPVAVAEEVEEPTPTVPEEEDVKPIILAVVPPSIVESFAKTAATAPSAIPPSAPDVDLTAKTVERRAKGSPAYGDAEERRRRKAHSADHRSKGKHRGRDSTASESASTDTETESWSRHCSKRDKRREKRRQKAPRSREGSLGRADREEERYQRYVGNQHYRHNPGENFGLEHALLPLPHVSLRGGHRGVRHFGNDRSFQRNGQGPSSRFKRGRP